ncbi:hypothetical protein BLNAU_6247 [Blattamonas nauphoetae]|uniref:Uncharacterized protein n=1 Tax=Blattamonas nauphoetae TaxID=2049346 RepID=A0ABQ9Y4V4_9EUKA|nr:hypothetical protein BLNAU_6247 [Blattamonas nauphoetae]
MIRNSRASTLHHNRVNTIHSSWVHILTSRVHTLTSRVSTIRPNRSTRTMARHTLHPLPFLRSRTNPSVDKNTGSRTNPSVDKNTGSRIRLSLEASHHQFHHNHPRLFQHRTRETTEAISRRSISEQPRNCSVPMRRSNSSRTMLSGSEGNTSW